MSGYERMTETTMLWTVITTGAGVAGLILTVMTMQARASNARFDDLRSHIDKRLDDQNTLIEGRFGDMNSRFDDMNSRFDDMNSRFDDVKGRFDNVNSRIDETNTRLGRVESRLDEMSRNIGELRDRTGKLEGTLSTFIQTQGKVEAA